MLRKITTEITFVILLVFTLITTVYSQHYKRDLGLPSLRNQFIQSDESRFGASILIHNELGIPKQTIICDLDGDARKDLLMLTDRGFTLEWRSNGKWNSSNLIGMMHNIIRTIAVGDLDRDGDLDIIGSSFGAPYLIYWKNNGAGKFEIMELTTEEPARLLTFIYPMDVDGDKDLDLVLGTIKDHGLQWIENLRGKWKFGPAQPLFSEITKPTKMQAMDIDGDKNKDFLVLGEYLGENQLIWLEMEQGKAVPQQILKEHNYNNEFVLGDFNGDRKVELVTKSSQPQSLIRFRFDGEQNQFVFQDTLLKEGVNGNTKLYHLDLDQDGDTEILVRNRRKMSFCLMNQKGQLETRLKLGNIDSSYELSFGAIDRSKGLDIIISVPESHRVALFSYDSESGKFSYQRNFLVRNNSLNLADLNSDGKPDLIFHDPASQQLKWADQQSLSEEGVGSASPLDTFWYPQRKYPVSVDLDQDNDLDFVFARDSSIWWLENRDGKGGKWLSEEIWTESRKIRNLYVQDFDRDGNLDILYTDAKSYCYLLTQIDSVKRLTFGKSKRLVDMSTGNPGNMAIGDYNKDGSLDFVSSSGRKNFLAFFKCSWLGGCLYPRYIGEGIKEARPLYILDFDQDGQNEVLGIESPEGKVFIVRQGQPVDYLIENERVMDLVVEDLDQDGDLDLLCGYQNIFWFENTDGFLLKHEISTKEWRAGYAYKVLYLDFNKDGKKDVITFRTTGEITLNLGLR